MIDDQSKFEMVRAMMLAKRTWLDSFSTGRNKRPDHEITARRRELLVLEAIADDYRARLGGQAS